LVVGFLALGEGWQHEDCVDLAAPVLGLLPVIAGLLPVVCGFGLLPFHGSIAFSSIGASASEGRLPAELASKW
jgi:hypothetical protein